MSEIDKAVGRIESTQEHIKDLLEDHIEQCNGLWEKQDARIGSLERTRSWAKGVGYALGLIGAFLAFALKTALAETLHLFGK